MSRSAHAFSTTEAQVQSAVLALLKRHPAVAWAHRMNTGVAVVPETKTTRRRFIRFAFKGCSDIIGQLRDGRFLAVECKRPVGGLVTDEQMAFIEVVNVAHGVAGVVRSVEDAQELLAAAGGVPCREAVRRESTASHRDLTG